MNGSDEIMVGERFRWADQIPSPLWDDVLARPAREAAMALDAILDNGVFKIPLVGVTYRVDVESRRITRENEKEYRTGYQAGVVLLTALARSMGVPPSGRMATPQELTGGSLFFTGAHALSVELVAKRFGNDPGKLIAVAEKFGGEAIPGADCAVRIPGLPLLPLYVFLWQADEEFSARVVIGIDDRALFHLDLAGIFALTNILVSRLIR